MKIFKIIVALVLLFSNLVAKSQSTTKKNDNELWVNSFEKAKIVASKKKVAIVLFFTGTDTCANCIKMRQNILDSKDFIEYSRDNFVMLHIDYPNGKTNKLTPIQIKKNKELAAKYNPQGKIPQIVVLEPKGGVKATANYLDIPVSEYLPQFKALLNMFK
ncbi:MAG: thioredoxin family protein [Bacteroidetes bacterium]|nr:thioredoxin family protein [Bacteroidota bacterium]